MIEKILFGVEKMARADNKITVSDIRFNLNACKFSSKKGLDGLSNTAHNFSHFVQAFGNKLKLCYFVNIWMVGDRTKNLDSVTCGTLQLYFYDNLFNPNKKSKIQDKAKLNKKAIETLLNELFVLHDQEKNKATIVHFWQA